MLFHFIGFLDSLGNSEDIEGKWTSQSEELLSYPQESINHDLRKLSPPVVSALGDSTDRCRSGSDPSISKPILDKERKLRNTQEAQSFPSPKSSKKMYLFAGQLPRIAKVQKPL